MRKYLCVLGLSVFAASAFADQIKLDGEYGCADPTTQRSRVVLMHNIVSEEPHYVDQRQEMKESLLNLSTYMCKPLSGQFKVLSRNDGMIQVQAADGSLWINP